MEKEQFDGYKYIKGGVCASEGFTANGLNCGINPVKEKNDLGLIYSSAPCSTAAVYTRNKVKGAPIIVTQKHLKKSNGISRAVIANSKNANTCNPNGEEIAEKTSILLADVLGIQPEEVIVASTGVIGMPIHIEPFENNMERIVNGLSPDGNTEAANAIMTTDTVRKECAVEFEIDGKTCHLGGMAKGSGMIHPDMATTLNFITTDASITKEMLQKALSDIVKVTYNCLSVDGDTSTNDMVSVMANGLAGNRQITEDGINYDIFKQALYIVMLDMVKMLAADGEGASKFVECKCTGAPDTTTAIKAAKSVISSSLVKCAVFGGDANCGRILCAIGYAGIDIDVLKIDVELQSAAGKILVCKDGMGLVFSEENAAKILAEDEIYININLNQGSASARAWGCDLTYDYVKINGDYRS